MADFSAIPVFSSTCFMLNTETNSSKEVITSDSRYID